MRDANGWFVFFAPRDSTRRSAGVVFLEHGVYTARTTALAWRIHGVLETVLREAQGTALPRKGMPAPARRRA